MEKLSLVLWRERELLELLAYKLEIEQLVLASGRSRWLAHANREIEDLLVTVRETEVLRAMAADEAGENVGLGPNPGLTALADAAAEPWRSILMEHRDALVGLTRDIADLSESNKTLITAGYRSARETLLAIGAASTEQSYTPTGEAVVAAPRPRLVDRSL
ncbi:flagellar protein FlgN [Nocardioides sp. Kera G14]|uniref:flagellar protein FlgN n=1 Tax=Nocardioides sp. Kera G14 TaxID=2884264 RepID=UPI001D11B847|nr:flagellar protein FlgN [Nocardioides sp. Kera G14]UDY24087.1 flagellar protein FlgN [Nocardioides sp. Kera G14]